MRGKYEKFIHDHLDRLHKNPPKDLGLIWIETLKEDSIFLKI
jgi:hypothetical protein